MHDLFPKMGGNLQSILRDTWHEIGQRHHIRVAIIPNKYFFFETIKVDIRSLKSNEIESMAKLAVESNMPGNNNSTTMSSYFPNAEFTELIVAICSKQRICSDTPELLKCKYWISEAYWLQHVVGDGKKSSIDEITILDVDDNDQVVLGDRTFPLFMPYFWCAELHDENIKTVARYANCVKNITNKLWKPVMAFSTISLIVLLGIIAASTYLHARNGTLKLNEKKLQKFRSVIELRNKLEFFHVSGENFIRQLTAINNDRPNGLFFTEYEMTSPHDVIVHGQCDKIADMNVFINTLNSRKMAAEVIDFSSDDNTKFSMHIKIVD